MKKESVQKSETRANYSIQADYQPRKKSSPDFSGLSPDIAQLRQLDVPFVTAESEFNLLHGRHEGRITFAFLEKTGSGAEVWHEYTYTHDEAAGLPTMYQGVPDVYESQNAFTFRRSLAHVRVITSAWVDCDTRNVGMDGISPDALLDLVLERYPAMPLPTLAIDSGRGVHFKWVFSKFMGKAQLECWQGVMLALHELLAEFGADMGSMDAAHVLRLVGSVNSKNGRTATGQQLSGPIEFESFRCAILDMHKAMHPEPSPKPRAQPAAQPATATHQPTPQPKPTTHKNRHRQPFTVLSLHEARLEDFRRLAASRTMDDGRKRLLHHYACSMAWYRPDARAITDECFYLALDNFMGKTSGRRISEAEARKLARIAAKSAITRLDNRDKVSAIWAGKKVDYRYTYRTRRILLELDITKDEMRDMRTLIDSAEVKRRREVKRRAKGIKPRAEYLATAEQRRDMVMQLRGQGMKPSAIADSLGMTKRRVNQILAAPQLDMFDDEPGAE